MWETSWAKTRWITAPRLMTQLPAPFRMTDLLIQHLERPAVQASLDDDEGSVQSLDERVGAEDVLEVVVTGAVVRRIREPSRVGTGLAREVT